MNNGGNSEVERMATLETDLKYVVKAVDKIDERFDKLLEHLEENYVSRREFDELKKSITWLWRTVVAASITCGFTVVGGSIMYLLRIQH